jgi:hypothetical protein
MKKGKAYLLAELYEQYDDLFNERPDALDFSSKLVDLFTKHKTREDIWKDIYYAKERLSLPEFNSFEPLYLQATGYYLDKIEKLENKVEELKKQLEDTVVDKGFLDERT